VVGAKWRNREREMMGLVLWSLPGGGW
jgi:hypothetical protein